MSTAKEYLKKQMQNPEFKQSFLNEKARLDIEYQLEELKRDIEVFYQYQRFDSSGIKPFFMGAGLRDYVVMSLR